MVAVFGLGTAWKGNFSGASNRDNIPASKISVRTTLEGVGNEVPSLRLGGGGARTEVW